MFLCSKSSRFLLRNVHVLPFMQTHAKCGLLNIYICLPNSASRRRSERNRGQHEKDGKRKVNSIVTFFIAVIRWCLERYISVDCSSNKSPSSPALSSKFEDVALPKVLTPRSGTPPYSEETFGTTFYKDTVGDIRSPVRQRILATFRPPGRVDPAPGRVEKVSGKWGY